MADDVRRGAEGEMILATDVLKIPLVEKPREYLLFGRFLTEINVLRTLRGEPVIAERKWFTAAQVSRMTPPFMVLEER